MRRDSVVQHHSVLAKHQAVATASHGQAVPRIGVDPVQKLDRVGAADQDLSERGHVHDPHCIAHSQRFPCDGRSLVLAGLRVVEGPLPLAHVLEDGAGFLVPGMHRRSANRVGQGADVTPGDSTERDGFVGRSEGRRAHCGNRRAKRAGKNRETRHVSGLALVGAHAQGGIALQVLDRLVAFPGRERDVGCGHVVLEIHESSRLSGAMPGEDLSLCGGRR